MGEKNSQGKDGRHVFRGISGYVYETLSDDFLSWLREGLDIEESDWAVDMEHQLNVQKILEIIEG